MVRSKGGLSYRTISLMGKDHVRLDGVVLPLKELRPGGPAFEDDRTWLDSGAREVDRLVHHCGLGPSSRVLDIGCGPGRLAIGLIRRGLEVDSYRGLDVNRRSIQWCRRYVTRTHPSFRFVHVDILNARYNPGGRSLESGIALPFRDGEFSIVYLYSVFSHMAEPDLRIYLKEIHRLLAPDGRVFLTAFIENGVPAISVNPADYRKAWRGPLHCVRYERGFFESMLSTSSLVLDRFDHATEMGGQSAMYLSRMPQPRLRNP